MIPMQYMGPDHHGGAARLTGATRRLSIGARTTGRARSMAIVLVVPLLLAHAPSAARAQATLEGEAVALGANALLGGLTSGIASLARGGPFLEAFRDGLAGGSVQYLGKRVASLRLAGAGLTGRMIGATGSSMIRNGAAGRGLLDLIVLPAGPLPVLLYWTTSPDSGRVAPKLHLGRTIFLARLILNDDLELNWDHSMSAGTPVFEARDRIIQGETGSLLGGLELWGTVSVSDIDLLPPTDLRRILAHERVHVVQDDFLNIAWADPLEDLLLAEIPGGDVVDRYLDVGVTYMGIAGVLLIMFPYRSRPWEREAYYMEDAL